MCRMSDEKLRTDEISSMTILHGRSPMSLLGSITRVEKNNDGREDDFIRGLMKSSFDVWFNEESRVRSFRIDWI